MESLKLAFKGEYDEDFQKLQNSVDYNIVHALTSAQIQRVNIQHQFRSYTHEINTIRVKKISLNARDSKRYICKDGTTTYPFGSILITNSLKPVEQGLNLA